MANSYTQFSEQIENITPEQAEWIETVLGLGYDEQAVTTPEEFKSVLSDLLNRKVEELEDFDPEWWPGFEWSTKGADKGTLWLYCEEGFQENHLTLFVQSFIRKFRPDYIFKLSGACLCSKMLLGEFGGIWLVITKDSILGGSTWDEIEQVVDALTPVEPKKAKA